MASRPVTSQELAEKPELLLKLKSHPGQPITYAYEGKVGAVYQEGKYFIVSPNMDYIPEPAFNPRMFLRRDNKFCDDDYLLWPQPYSDAQCHLACVPRINPSIDPTIITSVLHLSYEPDFFVLNSMGTLQGLGHLRPDILKRLQGCHDYLSERQTKYESNPKYSQSTLGRGLLVIAKRHVNFLANLPMNKKQLDFIFSQTQRLLLEHVGFIRYLTKIKPKMLSSADTISEKIDAIGAFFHTITDAQMCFEAGLPVWLILPANRAGTVRVDAVVDTIKAKDVLVTEKHPTDHRGVYFTGHTLPDGYRFFLDYTRQYLSGSNPFRIKVVDPSSSIVTPSSIASSSSLTLSSSTAEPSASDVSPPRENISSVARSGVVGSERLKTRKRIQPYSKSKPNKAPSTSGLKTLTEPSGRIVPPSLPVWSGALRSVDTDPKNRKEAFLNCPSGLAFPDPALFVGVQTEAKQALFFTNWLRHRTALLYRVSSSTAMSRPINNQLWRTLLNLPLSNIPDVSGVPAADTKSAKRIQIIQEVFLSCINNEDGVSISEDNNANTYWRNMQLTFGTVPPLEIAREIMWELFELNFRFEFVALDERMSVTSNTAEDRQVILGKCFPSGNSSLFIVKLEDANQGLTAPLMGDRLPFILALRAVMESWDGFGKYEADLNIPRGMHLSDAKVLELEELLACFYTQSFFNCFGRAPILPHSL